MGKRIGDLLIEGGAINEEQLDAALKYKKAQKEKNGKDLKLGECLINMGATTDRKIAEAIGQQLRMQVVDLTKMELNPDVVNMVKSDVLRKLYVYRSPTRIIRLPWLWPILSTMTASTLYR